MTVLFRPNVQQQRRILDRIERHAPTADLDTDHRLEKVVGLVQAL